MILVACVGLASFQVMADGLVDGIISNLLAKPVRRNKIKTPCPTKPKQRLLKRMTRMEKRLSLKTREVQFKKTCLIRRMKEIGLRLKTHRHFRKHTLRLRRSKE